MFLEAIYRSDMEHPTFAPFARRSRKRCRGCIKASIEVEVAEVDVPALACLALETLVEESQGRPCAGPAPRYADQFPRRDETGSL